MKNILYILCLLLLASCGGDDDMNPTDLEMEGEGMPNTLDTCTTFEPIYVTDLCAFYEEPNVLIEDEYNGKCLNIFGSITDIADKDDEVRVWLSAYPTEILCLADVAESAIRCTFEKSTTSDSILTIINKYNEGDFVSIKGLFDSEAENTFFQDIFVLESNYIADEPLSYENHCGISGKKWKCYNNCYRDFYWFIPSEDGLMLYVSSTQVDKENNGTLSTWIFNYEIGSNCDELTLTDNNDGSIEVYQITSLTRTELILINEGGVETKLEKVI